MSPDGFLREDALAIEADIEHAAGRRNQLRFALRKMLLQLGRQTGGPLLIISNDAVLDDDAHGHRGGKSPNRPEPLNETGI